MAFNMFSIQYVVVMQPDYIDKTKALTLSQVGLSLAQTIVPMVLNQVYSQLGMLFTTGLLLVLTSTCCFLCENLYQDYTKFES